MKWNALPIRPALLAGVATLALSAVPAKAAIVITDGSFESPDIANGGALAGTGSSGWYSGTGWTGDATYLVDNGVAQNQWFNQPVPDGQQAASLAGKYFMQQLNDDVTGAVVTGATAQQFDISFFAGRRKENTSAGTFSVILQAYSAGGAYVGDIAQQKFNTGGDDGLSSTIDLNLGVGNWTSSAINLTLIAGAGQFAGNNIRLVFAQIDPYGSGMTGEAAIDQVSVAAVPEPGTYGLIGAGGLALASAMRRRRKARARLADSK